METSPPKNIHAPKPVPRMEKSQKSVTAFNPKWLDTILKRNLKQKRKIDALKSTKSMISVVEFQPHHGTGDTYHLHPC